MREQTYDVAGKAPLAPEGMDIYGVDRPGDVAYIINFVLAKCGLELKTDYVDDWGHETRYRTIYVRPGQ